ncbi:MAG: CoA transferase [Burkholderiales bacterium]|nr:CoA transferase [Burkholderiales bacterium]
MLAEPHLAAIGYFARSTHPSEGEIRSVGIPVTFSRTPGSIRRLAPRLGEHAREIRDQVSASNPAPNAAFPAAE